jgi:hypothetical protein
VNDNVGDRSGGDLANLFDEFPGDPDDAVPAGDLRHLRELLRSTQPTLDTPLWERLLGAAADPAAPDPGVELVTGAVGHDGPFDLGSAGEPDDPAPRDSTDHASGTDRAFEDDPAIDLPVVDPFDAAESPWDAEPALGHGPPVGPPETGRETGHDAAGHDAADRDHPHLDHGEGHE